MDDYWRDFVRESEEHITELNNSLLALERSPTDDDAMESIFRSAHTLKGNCGAMGLARASDLAHAIEDLLDAVRSDDIEVTSDLMDTIFEGVDALERMIDDVGTYREVRTDPTPAIESLRAPLEDADRSIRITAPTTEEIDTLIEQFGPPADDEHDAFFARLSITEADDVNNGRLVVDALVDAFDLLGTVPSREAIENGEYGRSFDAIFGSAVGEDAITAALLPIDAVGQFEIVTITDRLEHVHDVIDVETALESTDSDGETDAVVDPSISADDAQDMSVDELLEEFAEFDDLDAMVEEVDDVSAFDDMGEAGSFHDLLGETGDEDSSQEPDATSVADDSTPAVETATEASVDQEGVADRGDDGDDDDVDDASAVFAELKAEVEMVGFDELQDELDELEFDEFDSDDEVDMDELLGEEIDTTDNSFLDVRSAELEFDDEAFDDVDAVAAEENEYVDAVEEGAEAVEEDVDAPEDREREHRSTLEGADADVIDETDVVADDAFEALAPDDDDFDAETETTATASDVNDRSEYDEQLLDDLSALSSVDFGESAADTTDVMAEEDGEFDLEEANADADANSGADAGVDTDVGVDAALGTGDADSSDDTALEESGKDESEVAEDIGIDDFGDVSVDDSASFAVDVEDDPFGDDDELDVEFSETDVFDGDGDGDEFADIDEYDGDDGFEDVDYDVGTFDRDDFDEHDFQDDRSVAETDFDASSSTFDSTDEQGADGEGAERVNDLPEAAAEEDLDSTESAHTGIGGEHGMEIPDITVPEIAEMADGEHQTDRIQSVRVDVDQIDTLLNLVEGLVTSRVRLRHALESGEDLGTIDTELDGLEDLTSELQETVMDVRLVPLQTVANRLPRVVRDISRDQDKEVAFELTGEDVELDRSILDRIGDPLIHLVRNAVDHGIETPPEREAAEKPSEGTVELRATRSRDRVTIDVEDDGCGLDPNRLRSAAVDADILTEDEASDLDDDDALELVFHPGLSTAEEVTDVSGRGVGMDIVKRTIDELDGTVTIESGLGEGTTVTMRLPVTVAIADVLFVECGGEEFGIPTKVVHDIEDGHRIETVDGRAVLTHPASAADADTSTRADTGADTTAESDRAEVPVVDLADILETPGASPNGGGMVVRIRDEIRPVGLHCNEVRGQQEVVIKPFEGFMSNVPGLSGATVRGRGEVVNILDVNTL